MSGFGFQRSTAETSIEAWEPLQQALHRWVLAHGGSLLLASTAAWASVADARADAAYALSGADTDWQGLPPLAPEQIAALRAEPLVGDGSGPAPSAFVIDAADRFYLWRNFSRERSIAERLQQRRSAGRRFEEAGVDDLDTLFGSGSMAGAEAQRDAVRRLPARRFAVLTGGPGTGKTSTVLRMLLMAQRQRQRDGLAPARIAITAPTGKAAQRLLQALHAGRRTLQVRLDETAAQDWSALIAQLPRADAPTLHRLLGYRPHDGRYARNHQAPLDADIVVVDEASMLDLALLEALLAALHPDAQLFLVGDADQLTSIGTGSVLRDLAAAMHGSDDLVRLEHGFRTQSPELARINAAARTGDPNAFNDAFDGHAGRRVQVATTARLDARLQNWAAQLATLPALRSLADAEGRQALAALDALASRQLLCALREGGFGARHASAVIERTLRRAWNEPADIRWYPGRAVLITRNDAAAGLYNGDVGICLANPDGDLRVWFEVAAEGDRRAIAFSPDALPDHDSAFAVTVHKSQGSEYDHIALLLPEQADHRILTRQMLYTGLSRARRSVELWCTDPAVLTALATPVRRVGGLGARVRISARPPPANGG